MLHYAARSSQLNIHAASRVDIQYFSRW